MNKLKKGKLLEKKVEDFLNKAGYETYKPTWNRWAKKDIFNLFDIIAILRTSIPLTNVRKVFNVSTRFVPPDLILLQVKSNQSDFYRARKQIDNWTNQHYLPINLAAGVILKEKKGFRIWLMIQKDDNYIEVVEWWTE